MKRVLIKELDKYIDRKVIVRGFIEKKVKLKSVMFLNVKDTSGKVQVIVDIEKFSDMLIDLKEGVSIEFVCEVVEGKNGIELIMFEIKYLGKLYGDLPIDISGKTLTSFEKELDWRYLQLRNLKYTLIFKIETTLQKAFRDFLIKKNFIEIHTPKILGSASESGAEVFELDYFGQRAYLAQSPQFFKQMAMSAGFDKVFEIAPCFRADRSKTSVHSTEFIGLDVEISWIKSHRDVMKLEEEMIKYGLKEVKKKYDKEIKDILGVDIRSIDGKIPIIELDEAIKIVTQMGHSDYKALNGDLDTQAQKLICDYTSKKYGSDFVFIEKYPYVSRPFYTMIDDKEKRLSKSFDLLWKGVEITSGSQREHRFEVLKDQIEKRGGKKEMDFYIDFFKFGSVPHGGFGLGLARFLMVMLDLETIKQATFLYRSKNRIMP